MVSKSLLRLIKGSKSTSFLRDSVLGSICYYTYNRLKKILLCSLPLLTICYLGFTLNSVFADTLSPETTLTSIHINQKAILDLEIIQWPDSHFSMPVKYTATLLELLPQQETKTKAITFIDPITSHTIRVDPQSQTILDGDVTYQTFKSPITLVSDGLFSKDDLYIDSDIIEKLFQVTLVLNKETLSVDLTTKRNLKLLTKVPDPINLNDDLDNDLSARVTDKPTPSTQLVDTLNIDLNTLTYQESQRSPTFGETGDRVVQFSRIGTTLTPTISGNIFGLPYRFTSRLNYTDGIFGPVDVQFRAEHESEKHTLTLGSLYTGLSPLISPSIPIWGIQMASKNASTPIVSPTSYREFSGKVTEPGRVFLEVNGLIQQSQQAIESRYQFLNIPLTPQALNQVRIYQKQRDGTKVVLYQEVIPYFSETLRGKESAYSVFAGRAPIQFKSPGTLNQSLFLPQSNKWVTGVRYYYGLNDRLTVGVSSAMDTIIGPTRTSSFSNLLYLFQNPDLTGYSSYLRDPNLYSGVSSGISLDYRLKDHWTFSSNGAISSRFKQSVLDEKLNSPYGLAGSFSLRYTGKIIQANAKLFHYDTGYYSPVTLGGNSLYDRQGFSVQTSTQQKGFLLSSGLDRYQSNLSGLLTGGVINVNHWTGGIFRRIGKKTDVRLGLNILYGQNELTTLNTQNSELVWSHEFPMGIHYTGAYRRANTRYLFNPTNPLQLYALQNQLALNTTLSNDLQIPFPNQHGFMSFGGSLSETLNLFHVQGQYRWRGLYIEPLIQKTFNSQQSLFSLGMGLTYEWSNGRRFSLKYIYNSTSIPGIDTGSNPGQRTSQQIQFEFSDTLAWLGKKVVSLGRGEDSSGILMGRVFLDLNKNGERDTEEPGIPKIPIIIDKNHKYTSDENGNFYSPKLAGGFHKINFDLNMLSVNLTPTTPERVAKIAAGKRTKVDVGLIITPGNLGGKIDLKDGNGQTLSPSDVVIVLKNEKGKELMFTYTDEKGHYLFSGVTPGKFIIQLGDKQINGKKIELLTKPYNVEVPIDYENFFDRSDLNFELIELFNK